MVKAVCGVGQGPEVLIIHDTQGYMDLTIKEALELAKQLIDAAFEGEKIYGEYAKYHYDEVLSGEPGIRHKHTSGEINDIFRTE